MHYLSTEHLLSHKHGEVKGEISAAGHGLIVPHGFVNFLKLIANHRCKMDGKKFVIRLIEVYVRSILSPPNAKRVLHAKSNHSDSDPRSQAAIGG